MMGPQACRRLRCSETLEHCRTCTTDNTTSTHRHLGPVGPFIPRSALNPSMGTCEVPVTNCSRRAKSSCTMLCTTAQNHEICACVCVCVCAPESWQQRYGQDMLVDSLKTMKSVLYSGESSYQPERAAVK